MLEGFYRPPFSEPAGAVDVHNASPDSHSGFIFPVTTEWGQLLQGSSTANSGSGLASVSATIQQMKAESGATAGSVGAVRSTYLPIIAGGTGYTWGAGLHITRAAFPMIVRIDALTANGALDICYGLGSGGNADLTSSKCWGVRITKSGALAHWRLAVNDGSNLFFSDPIETAIDAVLRNARVCSDGVGGMQLHMGADSVGLAAPVGVGNNFLWLGARNNADAATNGISLFGFRTISAQ